MDPSWNFRNFTKLLSKYPRANFLEWSLQFDSFSFKCTYKKPFNKIIFDPPTSTIEWNDYKSSQLNQFRNFTYLRLTHQNYLYPDDRRAINQFISNAELYNSFAALRDANKLAELKEWIQFFVPDIREIDFKITYNPGQGLQYNIRLIDEANRSIIPFELISNGTLNLIAIIATILNDKSPKFICIEEPENGLNPYIVRELVQIFRNACMEKGHYIWLNSHSQTLVSELTEEELITVSKTQSSTRIKQFKPGDFHGLRADEAWLTNVLGGGNPW